jgi:cell division transport system ATP-binding protein
LINEPRLLLADEPTGNLDPEASKEIMELLLTINKRGTAVLMVTHDHGLVKKYPHRTVLLKEGKIKDIAVS